MFNDSDPSVLKDIFSAREKYQAWEAAMEDAVCADPGKALVVVEIGCGLAVPSCRHESYEVVRDVAERGGKVSLVRVNFSGRDAGHVDGVDLEVKAAEDCLISLEGGAESLLLSLAGGGGGGSGGEGGSKEAERTLTFDDEWGDNEEGVKSHFGEFREDDEVVAKEEKEQEEEEEESDDVELENDENAPLVEEVDEARALIFDDDWGDNEEGVKSTFGEFRDDEDVKEKHEREEEEGERMGARQVAVLGLAFLGEGLDILVLPHVFIGHTQPLRVLTHRSLSQPRKSEK